MINSKSLALVYVWGSRGDGGGRHKKKEGGGRRDREGQKRGWRSAKQKALWLLFLGSRLRGQEVVEQYPALQVRTYNPHPRQSWGSFTLGSWQCTDQRSSNFCGGGEMRRKSPGGIHVCVCVCCGSVGFESFPQILTFINVWETGARPGFRVTHKQAGK